MDKDRTLIDTSGEYSIKLNFKEVVEIFSLLQESSLNNKDEIVKKIVHAIGDKWVPQTVRGNQ